MAVEEPRLFANNFWGKDDVGYNVLMHKMNMGKKTCEDLKALYSAKASLHEEFGKKLAKQTKMELGREETGTLKVLFASAQKEMEAAAQANIELAQKVRSELELSMDNFILEQKDRRKLVQTNVDKAHRNKQLHAAHVTKAKEKYEAECAKHVSLESQLTTTTGFREADRLRQKLERSQNEIKTLEKEYKNACSKLADATAAWNSEWKVACYRFQDMEEKRIEFLHHSLCIYVNILSTASGQDQESYERFWKALDQCNPKADIEQFIEEKGTGNMIPEPPVYVDYNDDPAKTLPRYQIAKFTENDNNFTTTTTATGIYNVPTSSTMTGTISSVAGGAITNIIKSTAKRSTSFCEPKRRTSTRLTKQLPPVVQQQRSPAKDEQIVSRLDNRRINLYASVDEKPKKPAPASSAATTANTVQQNHHEDNEEEAIDPRAQVVFSIGNNMFSIDNQHTAATDTSTPTTPTTSATRRPSVQSRTKRRSTSSLYHEHHADMEEAFSDSIKGLLQELGVQQQQPPSTTRAADKMRRRKSLNNNSSNNNINNNGQQHYPMDATTTTTTTTAAAAAMNVGMTVAANTPMMMTTMNGNRSMIWARALYDYYSERPEDLSFTRGQWLAIVRNDDHQWWLAHKWDDASGRLSETCGYVASNFVQIC